MPPIGLPQESALVSTIRQILTSRFSKIGFALAAALAVLVFGLTIYKSAASLFSVIRGEKVLNAALGFEDANNYAEAIPRLNAALREQLTPAQRARAFGERGWCYTHFDRDADAIRDFDAALAIDPSLFFAVLDRGLAFHRQGKFDEAMSDYAKAIRLNRNALDAYRNRALIFAQRGQLKEASADMDEAIRCAPDDPRWYGRRADFYLANGELNSALASFESAIRIDPENVEGHYGRARVLSSRGERGRAIAGINEFIRRWPKSPRLFFARALIHEDEEELDAAVEDCAEAIELKKDFAAPYADRAVLEFKLGGMEAALRFRKARN